MRASDIIGIIGALLFMGALLANQMVADAQLPLEILQYIGLVGVLFWVYYNIENFLVGLTTLGAKSGALGLIIAALALGIFFAANFLAHRHPNSYDATDKGLYTLAPQTKKIVGELQSPLRVIAFFNTTTPEKQMFSDLMDQYRTLNPNITVQWVDYDYEPALTKQYEIRRPGTVVLELDGKTRLLTELSEEEVTNHIINLTQSEQRTVLFLTGHGERSIDESLPDFPGMTQAASELRKKGFLVDTVNPLEDEGIPEEARVLVIASPQREPLPREMVYIDNFMARGGRIILLTDRTTPDTYLNIARERGIQLPPAMIVDPISQAMVGDASSPYVGPATNHEIVDPIGDNPLLLNMARPVIVDETAPEGTILTALAMTTPNAWGETDLSAFDVQAPDSDEVQTLRFDEGIDYAGPLTVMALAEWQATSTDAVEIEDTATVKLDDPDAEVDARDSSSQLEELGALVVIGDSDFASDRLFSMYYNGDLFLNTVSYLAKAKNLISIRARSNDAQPFVPTAQQGNILFYSSIIILPGLSFLLAFIMNRRKKRL